jgi:NADPH:quinone reductase
MPWVGRAQHVRHVLAVPPGEWLLQSAARGELGHMIIRLAHRNGIRTINVIRRREAGGELERSGADAAVVSTEGPIDEQVRRIVGQEGIEHAIDPVVGEIGTQIYQAPGDEGHMLVYGSLTSEPIRVGADPRDILAGWRDAASWRAGGTPHPGSLLAGLLVAPAG